MNLAPLLSALTFWLAAWALNEWLVRQHFRNPLAQRTARLAVPLLFGITILVLWEGIVRGTVPPVNNAEPGVTPDVVAAGVPATPLSPLHRRTP